MAHHTVRSGYQNLVERLNRFPQGAPPSELLYRILEMLFSEKEAQFVSLLPIKPFTAKTAAKRWKTSLKEARTMLDTLASRGILLDIEEKGESVYVLPPPMAGFFEFSMMRIRTDVNQKVLAELFYQYLNIEEDFIRDLFRGSETQLGRVFVNEQALSAELSLHVLDYERATEVIRTATYIGVGICYCRHKMEHLGRVCDAPQDICMTFNNTAASLTRHGIAREVSIDECLDLLGQAHDYNLVQFGENVRERVNFICNCCKCCCEAMIAAQKFGFLNPVHTTNYLPRIATDTCTGCGKCADICPVDAIELVAESGEGKGKKKSARLKEDICLGCGLCVRSCPVDAIELTAREERVITPVNSTHKAVLMAIERGNLPDLIFDNRAHWNHRAMAAILSVILKLPPVKQALASKQLRSRYLEYILS
ncbi:MAG: 4Fe-4S binding protein [Candidatus Altiarchaeota archaeon]|nr:4Fe-4S binding protein [Candidatus Altiarchaeota archaeon]